MQANFKTQKGQIVNFEHKIRDLQPVSTGISSPGDHPGVNQLHNPEKHPITRITSNSVQHRSTLRQPVMSSFTIPALHFFSTCPAAP